MEAGIDIIGFIDDNKELIGKEIVGLPVLGCYKDLYKDSFKENIQAVYCPIGNNHIRAQYLSELYHEGYKTPSFIHRSVSIAPNVTIGQIAYILVGSIIMPHTTIGNFFMMSQGSTIAHHTKIEDGCFVSSGVNIGAGIQIHDKAYIGMGSTIMTGVERLGKNCLVGAGCVVIRNIPDNAVMVGNPGKIIKYQEHDEIEPCKP